MGKVVGQEIKCGRCGNDLSGGGPDSELLCPTCGSAARQFLLTINETIVAHSSIGLKARRGGSGKPFYLFKSGASFFRKAKAWYRREMIVDRENDRYKETVINPETGEIVHFCEESLSQHQGHGSAKKKLQ